MFRYTINETESGMKMPNAPEFIFMELPNFNKSLEELVTYPDKQS